METIGRVPAPRTAETAVVPGSWQSVRGTLDAAGATEAVPPAGHGCDAEWPADLTGQGRGDILQRVRHALARDHVWLAATATAFCTLFAAIPAVAVLVSPYALLVPPAVVHHQLEMIGGLLPEQASRFLADQLQAIAPVPQLHLGAGRGSAVVAALWSARAGATRRKGRRGRSGSAAPGWPTAWARRQTGSASHRWDRGPDNAPGAACRAGHSAAP
jgi:hypothetical protein